MLTFYRTNACPDCDHIQSALEEMSLAHKVSRVDAEHPAPEGKQPPVLVDDERVIAGNHDIMAHLDELEALKQQWDKYQSDACYCDDEGEVL